VALLAPLNDDKARICPDCWKRAGKSLEEFAKYRLQLCD
jgi:hypothetical protein